ncbi:MAG: lipopolysaccharide biosynthesis protein [Planctomycetota bacterium]|nr:lipopolysaccharide biosynthesis protein [Planctomycetota bacterium]MDG2144631.1 lipopolysaccharide biosynthesis protein [Planctomycetota bacterium]
MSLVPKRLVQSRFVRDAFTLQVAAGITALGNLASTLALAYLLGVELQGLYYVAMAWYSLFYLLGNVGLNSVAVTYIAKAVGARRDDDIANWLAFLLKATTGLSLLMFALAYFLLPPVAAYYGEDPGQARMLGEWAVLLCLLPIIEVPRVVAAAAFQGTRQMLYLAQLENAVEVGRVFLIIAFILITGTAKGAVFGTLAGGVLSSCLAIALYFRARRESEAAAEIHKTAALPTIRQMFGAMGKVPLREGLPMGIRVGLNRNIDALLLDSVPVLIMGMASIGGPATAAYFRIAQRLLRMPLMLLQGISRTAVPAFAELSVLRDGSALRRLFYKATIGGGAMISSGIIATVLVLPWVVDHFFPSGYAEPVAHFSYLLAAGFISTAFSGVFESFYLATNQVHIALRIGTVLSLPVLAAMYFGGVYFGPSGVAIGLSLGFSTGIVHHIYIYRFFRKRNWNSKVKLAEGGAAK